MELVNLSPVNQPTTIKKQPIKENIQKAPEEKKNGKKLLAAGAAATATIGIAAILLTRGKNINKAKELFNELINKAQKGHNNILSETIQEENKAVQEFINNNSDEWDRIKKSISELIDIKEADEVLPDNVLYHGTSTESTKNILTNGVTPFSQKRRESGSGMGYGFYTTPNLEAAQFYSNGGYILPFRINGKIATLKEGVNPDDIKINITKMTARALDPIPENLNSVEQILYGISKEAEDFAKENQSFLATKIMQELGVDAIYTKGATSRGGPFGSIFNQAPEFLDNAGQVAIFNGKSVELITDKAKELNQITSQNYRDFI